MSFEVGDLVVVCIPILGPGGGRKIMLGEVLDTGDDRRPWITCDDGKNRVIHVTALRHAHPLEALARQAN